MAEANVEVEGVNYFTLYEPPDSQNESAPCVLLIHALMSNLHMYDSTVRALHAAGYSTLRYDHPGHHNTPAPLQRTTSQRRMSVGEGSVDGGLAYHMDDLTRHAHAIAKERLGGRGVRGVMGCSIGGVLALRYAMLFPDEVEQVISIAAPGIVAMEDKKPLWTQRIELFEKDQRDGTENLHQQTVARWFPGDAPEDEAMRQESLRHVRTCSLEGYKLLADTIRHYDYSGELGRIKGVRSLIAGGTEDGAISLDILEDVAGKVEGAEFVRLEGAGHLPPMHQPEKFEQVMLEFLGKP